jgi:hypothetical protein
VGLKETHRRNGEQQQKLGGQQPAATTAEKRRRVAVHHRRPEELKDVGLADQREETDRFQIDIFNGHPRLERAGGERER